MRPYYISQECLHIDLDQVSCISGANGWVLSFDVYVPGHKVTVRFETVWEAKEARTELFRCWIGEETQAIDLGR
jgi:hypothetical protein